MSGQGDKKAEKLAKQKSFVEEEDNEETVFAEEINPVSKRIQELETQVSEKQNALLSSLAEMENLRKRTEREVNNVHKYAVEKFAKELLVVIDNLERCLVNKLDKEELYPFFSGVDLTLKSLLSILKNYGMLEINPLNQAFDPNQHEAVTIKKVEGVEPNTVVEVIQKGYWFKDRILRPAAVVVSQ